MERCEAQHWTGEAFDGSMILLHHSPPPLVMNHRGEHIRMEGQMKIRDRSARAGIGRQNDVYQSCFEVFARSGGIPYVGSHPRVAPRCECSHTPTHLHTTHVIPEERYASQQISRVTQGR
jgi:hypothetical protein